MKKKTTAARTSAGRSLTARPSARTGSRQPSAVIPGEVILGEGDIIAFQGRQTVELTVANTGDRPIQVGSHCHFFEVNRALRFDREGAYG
jgi:hypothetical protein